MKKVLNPTYLYEEVWPGNRSTLAIWRASLIFTGGAATLLITAMLLTSLPVIRRKYFNIFYFTHLVGLVAIVVVCLHASTMFYCIAPGLSMWLLDWGLRSNELRRKLKSRLKPLGRGWYRFVHYQLLLATKCADSHSLTVILPHSRLAGYREVKSPLAHFHIHHSASSRIELHPFTTITHLASEKVVKCRDGEDYIFVEFLFREMESKGSERPLHPSAAKRKQWTTRLASLVDDSRHDQHRCIGFPYRPAQNFTVVSRSVHPAFRLDSKGPNVQPGNSSSRITDCCDDRVSLEEECIGFPYAQYDETSTQAWIGKETGAPPEEKVVALSSGSTTPSRHTTASTTWTMGVDLSVRLEGPYFTAANPMAYETVVCFVAGTGITGAIAIAIAFRAYTKRWRRAGDSRTAQKWVRCVVVWSVRSDDFVEIPVIQGGSMVRCIPTT